MTTKEEGLRRRIGSDQIIGCYHLDSNGLAYFNDIRGVEGDLVKLPGTEGEELTISCDDLSLEQGVFYSFRWLLDESTNRIEMVGDAEKVDNEKFLQRLFDARLRLQGSNLELFNSFQKTIFNEVTGAQHTYIYELLQNANDYPYLNEKVRVKFILTDHYLFFLHSGDYFSLRNIVGISSVNQGEKAKNIETIGYKGIGFKTVFVNNEYVYLRSGNWSLRFDRAYSEEKFYGECPWALMPIPTNQSELDDEIVNVLSAVEDDMRVQFALRHKSDARSNIQQLDKVFSDNQILLFIPNVNKVDVVVDGNNRHIVEKDENRWVVEHFSYPVPSELKKWVETSIKSGAKVPEKFKDIDFVRISFAVGRDGIRLEPVENARVYNYLPTEIRLGFNFLFNADFIPDGSRSGLHDVEWNDHVMEQCGRYFADFWTSFLVDGTSYDLESVFYLLPEFNDRYDHYGKLFLDGFTKRIKEIPCIPVICDNGYKLVKLSEIIHDRCGIIVSDNPAFTDEEFYHFGNKNGFLPHPSVRNNKDLIRLLHHCEASQIFNGKNLSDLLLNSDFKEWLAIKENNIKFVGYLLRSEFISNFWSNKIFLSDNGEIKKASDIYFDIDKYIDDIGFMSAFLPRIDVEVRNALTEICPTWTSFSNRFMDFNISRVTRIFFNHDHTLRNKCEIFDNSVHFIHFLAITNYQGDLPSDFPFFTDEDQMENGCKRVFLKNEIGESFKSHPWVNENWIHFLHPNYLRNDCDIVENFLMRRCGIKELTHNDCFTKFIADEKKEKIIAQNIQNIENNVDFYRYLSSIQNHIGLFTQSMRRSFTLLTTDGQNENLTPITKTIYWQDEDWTKMSEKSWMPSECCLGISDIYFCGLNDTETKSLRTLFATKQLVQVFRINTFFPICLEARLGEVYERVTNKETSYDFLNFLFEIRSVVVKDNMVHSKFKKIPVLCRSNECLEPINSQPNPIFIIDDDINELYEQPWFDQSSIRVCDESYSPLFDGRERREFFAKFGIRSFNKIEYARTYPSSHFNGLVAKLQEWDCSLSFYRYFASIHEDLSQNDMAAIKKLPVFIAVSESAGKVVVNYSTSYYLPSEQLNDIIDKDLVPNEIVRFIHPSYLTTDKEREFFREKLGNNDLDLDEFIDRLVEKVEHITPYLKEKDRNINFWKWVSLLNVKTEQKRKLRCFPLLCDSNNQNEETWEYAKNLYISNAYYDGLDIEEFVKEYVNNAQFVSSCYVNSNKDNQETDWKSLFKVLDMVVDIKEILFKKVLPRLDEIKKTSIVPLLSQYVDDISKRLRDPEDNLREQMGHMQLLCEDGMFRNVHDVVVSGGYFDITIVPFPEITIGNLVSEQYITDCGENDERRRSVVKLMTSIADTFSVKCETMTRLRDHKIKHFLSNQDQYIQSDAHFMIVAHLNEAYNKDSEGIDNLFKDVTDFLLCSVAGQYFPSKILYLSSAYHPTCDYMANGVRDLEYVSEHYLDYSSEPFSRFFRKLQIKDSFTSTNLPQLSNEQFSLYFWNNYAENHENQLKDILTEQNLKDIPCIPSPKGILKPKELYDYRNSQLQKMVLKLSDGENKLPSIGLPTWMSITHIGFRGRLSFPDCIEYLSLNIIDYRREVIDWIVTTSDDIINKYSQKISEYVKNAQWINGEKQWVPLRDLRALEWENKTLKDNFSGNAFICNPSYMPEYKYNYEQICKILNIQILTNNDFQKRKDGKSFEDVEAIKEFKKRLLYLAYKSGEKDWQKLYKEYNDKLSAADVASTERIIYFYNENIETDLQVYAEDANALWYVGGWNGPMFLAVLDWIIKKIGIKGAFDNNFLQKLFLNPFKEFINKQEGGALPQEFLNCLDDVDKEGFRADDFAHPDVFEEGKLDSFDLLHKPAPKPDAEDSNDTSAQFSTSPRRQTPHSSSNQPSTNATPQQGGTTSSPTSEQTDRKHAEDTVGKQSTAEKLKQEFEAKSARTVGRPTSSPKSYQTWEPPMSNNQDEVNPDPDLEMGTLPHNYGNSHSHRPFSSKVSKTIFDRNNNAQEQAEHAAEQVNLFELWQETEKYSYLWFKYLMKLQNSDRNEPTRRTVQIDFSSFKLGYNNKILHLSLPSALVPKWIEDASVKISAIGNVSRTIKGAIVKVDNMEIDILIDAEDIPALGEAKKVRIHAESLTNIIDSLETRFLQLGYVDDYDMQANLPKDIHFVYGPPGTGKTTRLVEKLHDIVSESDNDLGILVLTPTNKAADVISEKLIDDDLCYPCLTRFGATESKKLVEGYSVLETRDTIDLSLSPHNIVVTTAARYAYDFFMKEDTDICDKKWDYIVVDEASMMDLLTITYVLYKSKDSKFIIAGDPKQIQPINDFCTDNIYSLVGLDSFKDAMTEYNRYPVETLAVQHRSVPAIGNLVSLFAYDGLVENDFQRSPQKPLDLDGIPVKDVNFVGFKAEELGETNSIYALAAVNKSAFHLYAAIFTYNMVEYAVKQITEKYPDSNYTIGVVCPYKAEANAVEQMLERKPLDSDVCKVYSGTVHRFQGDECDIMFVILNPPLFVSSDAHVNNVNILNVAMSRARDYIFFVVPDAHIKGFDQREVLWNLVDSEHRTVQSCPNIEEVVFGDPKFIYKNTNLTPHLPVNVYYDNYALYEVRMDESTIDIEINDGENRIR